MVKLSITLSIFVLFFAAVVQAHIDSPLKRHHSGTAASRRRAALNARSNINGPAIVVDAPAAPKRSIVKRRKGGRCAARSSSTAFLSAPVSSFTFSAASTSLSVSHTVVPGNVGGGAPKSSKAYQAPAVTTPPAPAPTSVYNPPKPSPSPPSGGGGGGNSGNGNSGGGGGGSNALLVGTKTGQGTYYGTGLGACGITSQDTDYIAAVSHILFDGFPGAGANPNLNPICGRKATAHYQGNSVQVTLVDRCVGCAEWDLDFSPSAFSQLADQALGRIDITWTFDSTSL